MNSGNILLIDIGNTNLKWSLLQAGRRSPVAAKAHRGVVSDQLATDCWADISTPDEIFLANVAGAELESGLISWMQSRWDEPRRWFGLLLKGGDDQWLY